LSCKICEIRRPRRFCPGIKGEICTLCCGTEREKTVRCPLDCEYLKEARVHEKVEPPDPEKFPNKEIRVSEQFLRDHDEFLMFLSRALLRAAFEVPGAIDYDIREALASLIRTYRTLESGLYYESLPSNPLAGVIHQRIQQAVEEFRREQTQRVGLTNVRDADVLGVLVFLQQLEIIHNNARPLGRAFIDFLRTFFPAASPATGSIISGGAPLIAP
jgi:hypothetical protein